MTSVVASEEYTLWLYPQARLVEIRHRDGCVRLLPLERVLQMVPEPEPEP